MNVLVTGGAGYIGSHTVLCLLEHGHNVYVLDDLSNSSIVSLDRVQALAGKVISFTKGSVLDASLLDKLFLDNVFDSVIHFAAFKAVGESTQQPIKYYENNVAGTLTLCKAMQKANVKKLVFSSSATVYGDADKMPLSENTPVKTPTNPYGKTKHIMEQILSDLCLSDPSWSVTILRYFNPVGAHSSGCIGEDPNGVPNNLMPFVSQVAVGKHEHVFVFGDDYDTPDGSGVRDYIHIEDLAFGHMKALEKLSNKLQGGVNVYNLGTGKGYSVFEVITAFEKASGRKIPFKVTDRRDGDVAQCWADPTKSELELGWRTSRDIEDMCRDAWNWQSKNPNGFDT